MFQFFTKSNVVEISNLLKIGVFIPIALAISNPLKQLLLGYNKQRLYVRIIMVMVVVNLIVMIALIPYFKIAGVLTTLILTEITTIFVYYVVLKRRIGQQLS